ncbi:6-bladed beta-propeller [Algoriphagus sp. AGSA1]|uniref:6-bladed beta-propeller n=1 Tax=Algoriphagus sp. AGSA1 TaxID=2907213 RepID=UPI001F1EB4BA|nr:6-bladed beta-propeller [Algoriphagus sp. AGSA1]MCE7054339.1 6-bladed beta-propeller [Algoriphagus sp. AGSA1]
MIKKSQFFYLRSSLKFLLLFPLGCSSSNDKGFTSFAVPKEAESEFQLSEIAKSVEYISLETSEASYLSLVQDVKSYKDRLYVVDFPGRILVFDKDGKFIQQIGVEGEGPGEFHNLSSFTIDDDSKTLLVASGRRLISYSLDNEYITEKTFPFFIDYIEIIDKSINLVAGEDGVKSGDKFVNQRSLFKINSDLEIVDSIPLIYREMNEQTGASYPYKNFISTIEEEKYIYTPVLTNESIIRDTLFKIDGLVLNPSTKLDFAPPLLNKDGNKLILIKNMILSKNFLICEYNREGKNMFFIGDRRNDSSINLNNGISIDNGETVVLRPLDLSQDQFYFVKTYNYSDVSEEELNPMIGIVILN